MTENHYVEVCQSAKDMHRQNVTANCSSNRSGYKYKKGNSLEDEAAVLVYSDNDYVVHSFTAHSIQNESAK